MTRHPPQARTRAHAHLERKAARMARTKKPSMPRTHRKAFITAMLDRFLPKMPPLSPVRETPCTHARRHP